MAEQGKGELIRVIDWKEKEEYWVDSEGKKQGECKRYHENGQLWEHCFYKDRKREGEYKTYYENGQPRKHCFYKDGKLEGEYKDYHENGQLWEQCFYKDGKREGEYKDYTKNGYLFRRALFKDGRQVPFPKKEKEQEIHTKPLGLEVTAPSLSLEEKVDAIYKKLLEIEKKF